VDSKVHCSGLADLHCFDNGFCGVHRLHRGIATRQYIACTVELYFSSNNFVKWHINEIVLGYLSVMGQGDAVWFKSLEWKSLDIVPLSASLQRFQRGCKFLHKTYLNVPYINEHVDGNFYIICCDVNVMFREKCIEKGL